MQQYVSKQTLADLGIKLNDADVDSLLAHLNETIEERIGVEIAESLDDDQLKELMELEKSASEEELGNWIAEHVTDYQEIVQDNIDIAVGEMIEDTEGINKAAQES